ncbi:hypothetical protein [Gordonia sp. OPL2]|uniref:hypothetical protein n=1 Tax=Gordonia sp. OPL2 TaxID=2486274 RepID=UPI0021CC66B7|nr:hypothetical protein [Gordonia sp. OPL2]
MSTPTEATVAHDNPSDHPTDQIPRSGTGPRSAAPAASDKMRNAVIAGGIGVAVVAAGLGFGAGYVVGDSSSSTTQGPGSNMPGGMNGQMPGGQGGMGQMPGGQGGMGQMPGGQGGMNGQMPGGQQGQMPGQQGQTPGQQEGQTAPGTGSSTQSGQSAGA